MRLVLLRLHPLCGQLIKLTAGLDYFLSQLGATSMMITIHKLLIELATDHAFAAIIVLQQHQPT